jgi:hypothetical protein
MKSRHFKRVPRFLDDDLRAKRLEGARQLFDRFSGAQFAIVPAAMLDVSTVC